MGSGAKFRYYSAYDMFALGFQVVPHGEHRLSVHINLGFWHLYLGFGKGYDEY